ncbi:MAG: type II toxin-antitoxin system ParD family antitoxin [Acidobacteriota bacterium]|nr:MAG: type II toxin-antitoxin system ParD family antitoxin [Acidobacteriota bacterium]
MTTMNISLPESLKSFVDSQVSDGDYGSSSEYVRELLRKEKDRVRLRELILDGMESELLDEPMDAAYFEKLRSRIAEKR